jgi:hypothetical protein
MNSFTRLEFGSARPFQGPSKAKQISGRNDFQRKWSSKRQMDGHERSVVIERPGLDLSYRDRQEMIAPHRKAGCR